jgi:predicted metalloprotease with PDZ domain
MAFPSMPDDQHWIEEGLATYVESIARGMTGELSARQIWSDMARDMHQGEPAAGDEGLDHTHTWGRTYWGGALFCLVADIEIRRETNNRKGLQDALRAIVAHGGTIDHDWTLPQALAIGDQATGTQVLTRMYAEWKDKPVTVDLPALWKELGIQSTPQGIEFVGNAPEAKIREAITITKGEPVSATVVPRQSN